MAILRQHRLNKKIQSVGGISDKKNGVVTNTDGVEYDGCIKDE